MLKDFIETTMQSELDDHLNSVILGKCQIKNSSLLLPTCRITSEKRE